MKIINLTENHKYNRVEHCLEFIDDDLDNIAFNHES